MRRVILAGVAAAALGIAAPQASAHTASVVCDPDAPGQYLETASHLELDPVWVYGPSSVVVTWTDGFMRTLPLPTGCAPPPPPPPPPVVTPPPVAPPPVTPPPPPPVVTPPPPPVVRTFDCAWVASHYAPRLRPKVARKLGLSCRFRPPAAKTCTDLLRVGAGPRWYTRLGFPYRCRVNPPVTG